MSSRSVRRAVETLAAIAAPASILLAATGCASTGPADSDRRGSAMLEVTVVVPEGAEPETVSGREAQVCIGIASDAWQWPGGPFERRAVASLVGRRASARFDELVPGHYAIVAFLDLDGDAELDRGAFGMPLEPIAYGNDAEPKLGPPPFKSCLVEVPESGAAAVMLLRVR